MKFDFDKFLPQYQITTPRRRAAFLAQCHHESQGFTRIAENLSYGTQALIRCWPSHFNAKNAGCYAHQPAKIANRAYANRMGNGPEKSGDGWLFRGRGDLFDHDLEMETIAFQHHRKIVADGKVGPQTRGEMELALAYKPPYQALRAA